MAVCAEYRISWSHFHGGPRRWTARDRDLAIWWHIHERERCGECGTRKSEWDERAGGNRHAYVAKKVRCPGCEARQRAEASIHKSEGRGIRVEMHRRG